MTAGDKHWRKGSVQISAGPCEASKLVFSCDHPDPGFTGADEHFIYLSGHQNFESR
jgi:hypothetical protein